MILAAAAQAAAAMPADRATLPALGAPAGTNNFSLFTDNSQTRDAHGALSLRVFGFERIAANGFDAPTPSSATDLDPAPIAFAALSSTTAAIAPGRNPVPLNSSAAIGLKFKLLG